MVTTENLIDSEKIIKVINKMDNLKLSKIEIVDGDYVIIDIEFNDIDPNAREKGFFFVNKKQLIAGEVLDKAKIKFSRTTADIVGANIIRMTVYPPRETHFEID